MYHSGLPVISVPLPSRQENCKFTLRPVSSTVGDFLDSLKREDKGIDRAGIYASGNNNNVRVQQNYFAMVNSINH